MKLLKLHLGHANFLCPEMIFSVFLSLQWIGKQVKLQYQ